MRFWWEMPKDLYHLYQINKLDFISEGYSPEWVKAAIHKARSNSFSQTPLFLAGLLSLIFSSVKTTASSGAKCDSGSHLSSPKLASAKDHQRRSPTPGVTVTLRNAINGLASAHVVGVCPDNLLNIKAESEFVQAADIAQTLCVTIGNSQNQQGLGSLRPRHVQRDEFRTLKDVQVTEEKKGSISSATLWYGEEVGQFWGACLVLLRSRRLISLRTEVTMNCDFFSPASITFSISSITSCGNLALSCCDLLLVELVGIAWILDDKCDSVYTKKRRKKRLMCDAPNNIVNRTLRLSKVKLMKPEGAYDTTRASNQTVIGVNDMACSHDTQTRPKFLETYWIVPCYESKPYGKVSFTRQDRRTFIALFKDSRLIWAGRQPVSNFTQGLKDPKSQKVGAKRSANSTMSAKGAESRSQSDHSCGLLVRKMSHEGIEEISIPQGMVNITPPSTITEIVIVQGVAHV